MMVFLNGRLVPEEQAVVSVFDRSFLYGDGLFETLRCYHGRPFRWSQHLKRLQAGAAFLGIQIPFPPEQLRAQVECLIKENDLSESLVRLTLSRGIGVRGYSPKGANEPTMVVSSHPVSAGAAPPEWRLITSSVRVPANEPLALHKTCNKLPQIMARAEAEARGVEEALLLNTAGEVAEAASSNLFWIDRGVICTPPLASGILAGVTRELVLELCQARELACREQGILPDALARAEALFLTMSSLEIVTVTSLDGKAMGASPLVELLRQAYAAAVKRETAG
jgi:aminodeoxychorismate lyase